MTERMRAYYRSTVSEFLDSATESVLNRLEDGLAADGFSRTPEQRFSWRGEIDTLNASLLDVRKYLGEADNWGLLLEYAIPGRHKRLDVVLLTSRGIIAIEFKVGTADISSQDKWQLREYCWNIRDFHRASAGHVIAPILVPTELAEQTEQEPLRLTDDPRECILPIQIAGAGHVAILIRKAFSALPNSGKEMPSLEAWDRSRISPSQSIIEATRELFGQHSVREIEHSHADNTDEVVQHIAEIVKHSQQHNLRSICFVTGVPGAGKTLVGLRIAYRSEATALAESAPCFASGNQKLLQVLGKALGLNLAKSRADIRRTVHDLTAPLWDVHKFARLHLADLAAEPPAFRVVVFDEAQRVWTAGKVSKAARQRLKRGNRGPELSPELANRSEPEHLLRVMEQFTDWCVVVALVGAGQEIHDGEAGLKEWGDVLRQRLQLWHVWASPEALHGGPSLLGQCLFDPPLPTNAPVHENPKLHLRITRRSFRAERLTEWVDKLLQGDAASAKDIATSLAEFRVEMARDLATARKRLREVSQEDQRIGLLASSGAKRLRAEGVEVQKQFRDSLNWPNWFLAPTESIHASNRLEVAATEFECQGLELDYTCVCWGTDLVHLGTNVGWRFRPARGKKLKQLNASGEGPYVLNKYRVLLTRAREGIIIFVPRGDPTDSSRPPKEFDSMAEFLLNCGVTAV